jgi:anti-sigma regulatory factor (Ser/Thr protein kinase)
VTLPGTAASVPAARQFIRRALTGCPRADDLAQAVTELAANAVAWSAAGKGGTFTVRLRTAPRWARIEVTDPGPARPPRAPLSPAAGNGWGLGIVTAVTDRSGSNTGPDRSRTAWAEVTWPPR